MECLSYSYLFLTIKKNKLINFADCCQMEIKVFISMFSKKKVWIKMMWNFEFNAKVKQKKIFEILIWDRLSFYEEENWLRNTKIRHKFRISYTFSTFLSDIIYFCLYLLNLFWYFRFFSQKLWRLKKTWKIGVKTAIFALLN